MSKQITFKSMFKILSVFTGILFVRQAAAGAVTPADAEATVAAAQAAAAAAEAAAAAARAAAAAAAEAIAAGSRLARRSAIQNPEASSSQGDLQPPDVSEQTITPPSSVPALAASTTSVRLSEDSLSRTEEGRARGSYPAVNEALPSAGDRTSPALPPGSSTAVDVSAEDNSTFEPRLYLPPQRPPLEERRRKQWLGEEAQLDVLLQQVLEQTAAQAWNAYRRHRFEALMEPTTAEFLVRRRERQREDANAAAAAASA
ncbi:hypothetical protein Emag_003388 [Eimeria magna]